MSSTPATEASGAAAPISYGDNIVYRRCCSGDCCLPLGPIPSPEPKFHAHMMNLDNGDTSSGFWGAPNGTEAVKAALGLAARRSPSSSRRGNKPEAGEKGKAGGTAAEAATAEAATAEAAAADALMLLNCPLALPALPARGVDSAAPVVPVCKLVEAANESKDLGEGAAMRAFKRYVHIVSTGSRVRKGDATQSRWGVGVFATQPFQEQEVVMAFKSQCTAVVSKRLAMRRRLKLNGYVVHDGGDPIHLDTSTVGFPAPVINNSAKPNVYVCTVTAGYSRDKYVFVCSLRSIAAGDELCHEPVERVVSL